MFSLCSLIFHQASELLLQGVVLATPLTAPVQTAILLWKSLERLQNELIRVPRHSWQHNSSPSSALAKTSQKHQNWTGSQLFKIFPLRWKKDKSTEYPNEFRIPSALAVDHKPQESTQKPPTAVWKKPTSECHVPPVPPCS